MLNIDKPGSWIIKLIIMYQQEGRENTRLEASNDDQIQGIGGGLWAFGGGGVQ